MISHCSLLTPCPPSPTAAFVYARGGSVRLWPQVVLAVRYSGGNPARFYSDLEALTALTIVLIGLYAMVRSDMYGQHAARE